MMCASLIFSRLFYIDMVPEFSGVWILLIALPVNPAIILVANVVSTPPIGTLLLNCRSVNPTDVLQGFCPTVHFTSNRENYAKRYVLGRKDVNVDDAMIIDADVDKNETRCAVHKKGTYFCLVVVVIVVVVVL